MPYKDPEKQKEWHKQYQKNLSQDKRDEINKKSNKYHKLKTINDPDYSEKLRIGYRKSYQKHRVERIMKSKKYNKNNPEIRLKNQLKRLVKLGNPFDMNSSEYSYASQSWSKSIKKRDNYTCQVCNIKGTSKNIHAHHILFASLYPKLSLNLNNGVSLCIPCHEELHGFNIY